MNITCYISTPTPTPPGLMASAQPTSSIPVVVPESRYHGNDDAMGIARATEEVGEGERRSEVGEGRGDGDSVPVSLACEVATLELRDKDEEGREGEGGKRGGRGERECHIRWSVLERVRGHPVSLAVAGASVASVPLVAGVPRHAPYTENFPPWTTIASTPANVNRSQANLGGSTMHPNPPPLPITPLPPASRFHSRQGLVPIPMPESA